MRKLLFLMMVVVLCVACKKEPNDNPVKEAQSLHFKISNVVKAPAAADVPKIALSTRGSDGTLAYFMDFVWNGSEATIDLPKDKHPSLAPIETVLADFKATYTIKISTLTVTSALCIHAVGLNAEGRGMGRFIVEGNNEELLFFYSSDDVEVKFSDKVDPTKSVGDLKLVKGWNCIKQSASSITVTDPSTIKWQFIAFK